MLYPGDLLVQPFPDGRRLILPPHIEHPGELTAHRPPLPALTGIRFLAALYVVLFHSRLPVLLEAHHAHPLALFLGNGALAVVLFFLLSGMILSYTYQGQIESIGGVRRFYEARIARVWPLYVISLGLSSLFNHTTPPLGVALATLCMIQAWNPFNTEMAGAWNFVCWTLSTEALFYLIFPFAQRWLERRNMSVHVAVLIGLLVLSIGLRTSLHGFNSELQWSYVPLAVIHVPEFLVGVCIGNLFNRRRVTLPRALPLPIGLWTTLAALATLSCLCSSNGWAKALCPLGFAALIYGLAVESSPLQWLLSRRILLIAGKISYGVYLLQWPVKSAANIIASRYQLAASGTFPLYIVLLLVVSCAGFFGVEEPSRKLLRAAFSIWERARGKTIELRQT